MTLRWVAGSSFLSGPVQHKGEDDRRNRVLSSLRSPPLSQLFLSSFFDGKKKKKDTPYERLTSSDLPSRVMRAHRASYIIIFFVLFARLFFSLSSSLNRFFLSILTGHALSFFISLQYFFIRWMRNVIGKLGCDKMSWIPLLNSRDYKIKGSKNKASVINFLKIWVTLSFKTTSEMVGWHAFYMQRPGAICRLFWTKGNPERDERAKNRLIIVTYALWYDAL